MQETKFLVEVKNVMRVQGAKKNIVAATMLYTVLYQPAGGSPKNGMKFGDLDLRTFKF